MLPFARSWLGVCLLLFLAVVSAQVPIPELSRHVTDLTGTLSTEQVNALEGKLAAFESEKGSQIAVLIVPTTQPEDIEQFGIRVADAWKIGREKVDDGVILIVAKDDRKLRLEVGYGLEGVIPDAVAKRVIAETITPYFKAGDFAGGIDAGVTQLMSLIQGEPLPASQTPQREPRGQSSDGSFMFILIGGIIVGMVLSALFGRVMGGMLAGFGSGAIASLLLGFGAAALMIALMVFFIVSVRSRGGGGWSSGGGFGGGFGGGGGGSSWGGGGGRFGGGGASGSW